MEVVKSVLSVLGSLTSIVGFVLTILIYLGVKSLKAFYVAKATVPNQLGILTGLRDRISGSLNGKFDTRNKDSVTETLAEVSAQIENLSPKLKEFDRSHYKRQIEPNLQSFRDTYRLFKSESSKANAREVGLRLFELIQSIQLFFEDNAWRRAQ